MERRLENKIDQLCDRMSTEMNEVRVQVDQLDVTLRGNGQHGIVTRLALHDERIGNLAKFADEVHGFRKWVVFGVVSLIASMVLQSLNLIPN